MAAVFAALLLSSAAALPQVRVLLLEGVDAVTVAADGPHRGYVDGTRRFDATAPLAWPVRARDGRLVVDGRDIGATLVIRPASASDFVRVDGRRYRGLLRVRAEGSRLTVINELDVESYLRGVVPAEMQAVWPFDALKAQAIAARTYTLARLDVSSAWDVCATDACQVYDGVAAEHPRADRAVAETAGLVLTYRGELAQTYYHADSGGAIASSAEVWGRALPYLRAQTDVRVSSPHRGWSVDLDPVASGHTLAGAGYDVGALTSLRALAYSPSGRVVQLEAVGTRGRAVIDGATLRDVVRAWGLKSTRIRVTGGLRVRGEGWGHGVGMSQYGARGLALAGYPYARILAFYYPDTRLQRLAYTVF